MSAVDLYAMPFWWFVGISLLIMVPIASATWRKWAFAGLNLSFLALHTQPGGLSSLIYVYVGVFVAWLVITATSLAGWRGRWAATVGGAAVLAVFLIHKLPHIRFFSHAQRLEPMLTAVGFSYVALRLIDVLRAVREQRQVSPDLPATINFLIPFHMISAGPIESYDDFVAQPGVPPPLTMARAFVALERVTAGLFKKFVLANYLDRLFLTGFHATGPYFALEIQLNFIWLYLDFSAYSDVAVGLGTLMGVHTPENFRRPYLARNVIEFWERWHISLSQFIRRNLFIPTQMTLLRLTDGNLALLAASGAFLISFIICGLWHGVKWEWFAWGIVQSAGLITCNLYRVWLNRTLGRKGVKRYLANPWIRVVAIFITFEFAAVALAVAMYPYQEISWWTSRTR
jgi:D-alanyl-lipoteichoic acid acyltransferase DltB (MBOAT superfamily)